MQMIDVALIDYDAELITENGKTYVLNDLLQSLSWDDQDLWKVGQRAQKAVRGFNLGMAVCSWAEKGFFHICI